MKTDLIFFTGIALVFLFTLLSLSGCTQKPLASNASSNVIISANPSPNAVGTKVNLIDFFPKKGEKIIDIPIVEYYHESGTTRCGIADIPEMIRLGNDEKLVIIGGRFSTIDDANTYCNCENVYCFEDLQIGDWVGHHFEFMDYNGVWQRVYLINGCYFMQIDVNDWKVSPARQKVMEIAEILIERFNAAH